jgi:hypothetical protein
MKTTLNIMAFGFFLTGVALLFVPAPIVALNWFAASGSAKLFASLIGEDERTEAEEEARELLDRPVHFTNREVLEMHFGKK